MTLEHILENSVEFFNYPSYSPEDWRKIATFLYNTYGEIACEVILDSKHMRYNPIKSYTGFIVYARQNLNINTVEDLIAETIPEVPVPDQIDQINDQIFDLLEERISIEDLRTHK